MQTEQKKTMPEHLITMNNRCETSITGVTEVGGFSDTQVELKTCMGGLIIKGKGLTISKLSTDLGELRVNGEISSIQYTAKKRDSIFSGLFG